MRLRIIRVGLALLAAFHLGWGGWALLWPSHFFHTFPGFGFRWTSAYPPFNEHLVTDLGATFVTLGLLLAVATASTHRPVRGVVLGGVLVFNSLHLAFHGLHRGGLAASDYRLSLVSLVAGVVAPAVLLILDRPAVAKAAR